MNEAIFFCAVVGFGMVCMGLAGLVVEGIERYKDWKFAKEWKL